jgi:hypothetical protein
LIICASYSWEMGLNLDLDALFDNCGTGNEYGRKLGKLIVRKLIYHRILSCCYTVALTRQVVGH